MTRRKIEKVQLVLAGPKRPDTYVIKFARWPQPVGILSIGAYLGQHNPGVEVEILDGNNVLTFDDVVGKLDADVVGVTTTAVNYDHAIEIAKIAKGRGARVVLGGSAATPLAKEILKYYSFVDAVIRYDGEVAFSKYISGVSLASIENLVYRDDGGIRKTLLACLILVSFRCRIGIWWIWRSILKTVKTRLIRSASRSSGRLISTLRRAVFGVRRMTAAVYSVRFLISI